MKNNTQYTSIDRQKGRWGQTEERRTLVYLDIENLLGPHRLCSPSCWTPYLHRTVLQAARLGNAGHLVVAAGRAAAISAGLALPAARLLVGHGVDGADKKILEDIDVEWISSHYTDVVFGSGDHIFAPAARALRGAGLTLGVVAVRRHASSRLLADADWSRLVQYPSHCSAQGRPLRAVAGRLPNRCGLTPAHAGMAV